MINQTKKIRLLIVEDSDVEAMLLQVIFNKAADIEIVGHAVNGKEAVRLAHMLKPDLITMDIAMPIMDGIEATKIIMQNDPTRIIILSSLVRNKNSDEAFRALQHGALTLIPKPISLKQPNFSEIENELLVLVRAMSEVNVVKHVIQEEHYAANANLNIIGKPPFEIAGLGCSTGGPLALQTILSQLPKNFPIPIVIVQHMFHDFILDLIAWLLPQCKIKLKLAEDSEALKPGVAYFCPFDLHFKIARFGGCLRAKLVHSDKLNYFRPAISILFSSLAEVCPEKSIGLLLSGMGDDGATGLSEMFANNCYTLLQEPSTCVVSSMVESALQLQSLHRVLPLANLSRQLVYLAVQGRSCDSN